MAEIDLRESLVVEEDEALVGLVVNVPKHLDVKFPLVGLGLDQPLRLAYVGAQVVAN